MKIITTLLILILIFLAGCSTQTDPEPEPKLPKEPVQPTKEQLVATCNSLCEVDKVAYCEEQRTMKLDSGTQTIGTCRTFAKYILGFSQCHGFCKSYGDETGCTLADGSSDRECTGNN